MDSGRSINDPQGTSNQSHNHSYGNSSITVSGANHDHDIRRISLSGQASGDTNVTLGSGQSYEIGYHTSNSGKSTSAIQDSGNLSMSGSVGITINNAGGSESRPRNIAMMYIIKF